MVLPGAGGERVRSPFLSPCPIGPLSSPVLSVGASRRCPGDVTLVSASGTPASSMSKGQMRQTQINARLRPIAEWVIRQPTPEFDFFALVDSHTDAATGYIAYSRDAKDVFQCVPIGEVRLVPRVWHELWPLKGKHF